MKLSSFLVMLICKNPQEKDRFQPIPITNQFYQNLWRNPTLQIWLPEQKSPHHGIRQCIHNTHVHQFVLHCTTIWRQPGLSWGCADFCVILTNLLTNIVVYVQEGQAEEGVKCNSITQKEGKQDTWRMDNHVEEQEHAELKIVSI